MALILRVDTRRWRRHLAESLRQAPGLVPVVKGNGYGFGNELLARECATLRDNGFLPEGIVAVGSYPEAVGLLPRYAGRLLVLEPFRRQLAGAQRASAEGAEAPGGRFDGRIIHTVDDPEDLAALTAARPGAAVAVEGLTSMRRFGATAPVAAQLVEAVRSGRVDAELAGMTVHLPLGTGHEQEVRQWLDVLPQVDSWFVSHLSDDELARLRLAYPSRTLRPRVGTRLWLGEPSSWRFVSEVLAVHPVRRGATAGYRQHRMGAGHLLVLSGGTAHGVGMAAPSSAASARERAIAVAQGVSEAAGRVRSPFTVAGRHTYFVEPPHMQVSLVHVPAGVAPPAVGDEVPVRMRATTAHPDEVRFGDERNAD